MEGRGDLPGRSVVDAPPRVRTVEPGPASAQSVSPPVRGDRCSITPGVNTNMAVPRAGSVVLVAPAPPQCRNTVGLAGPVQAQPGRVSVGNEDNGCERENCAALLP